MPDEEQFRDAVSKFQSMDAAENAPAPAEPEEKITPPEPVVEGAEAKAPEPEKSEPQQLEAEFVEFSGKQKERFNKVYGRMRQLERQNMELLQRMQQPPAELPRPEIRSQPSQAGTFTKAKPKLSEFEDADKWADAVSDWSTEKAQHEATRLIEQRLTQTQAVSQAHQQMQQYNQFIDTRVNEGRSKYSDFDDVSEDLAAVSSEFMVNQIFKLNRFPDVVMELGKNLPEAERIARLSPEDQVYELRALERKISSREELAKKQQQKTPTKVERPGQGGEPVSPTVAKLRQEAIKSGDLRDFAKVFQAMDHSG